LNEQIIHKKSLFFLEQEDGENAPV